MPMGKGTYGSKRGRPKTKAKSKSMKAPKSVKGVSMTGLTTRQANAMKKHSVHHTAKHLRMMATAMKKGKSFGASHKMAQKKVGK
jgi:hypothetical protein|tara:strand:+ start:423 stop:677 length:255 start_codon:yes stop_codon:yes gene_type:complete